MPKYDYKCKKCNANFFIECGINEPRENVTCSQCGSTEIARIFRPVILKGSRAKGYQDEAAVPVSKPAEEGTTAVSTTTEVKETAATPPAAPEKAHTHEHCSPELDYP